MGQRPGAGPSPARSATALAALLTLALLFSAPASAKSLEQVGCFAGPFPGLTESCKPVKEGEEFGEEAQLNGIGDMAVNVNGSGGVPAGTVYAVTAVRSVTRVSRFEPDLKGGGLKFVEAWEVTAEETAEPPKRCGPLLGVNKEGKAEKPCTLLGAGGAEAVGIDIDQTTGNVYVFRLSGLDPGQLTVSEYSPDGSKVIARFGKVALGGKTTAETPEEMHSSQMPGGIAVNASGEVYVFDLENFFGGNFYHRLMVFRPQSPGDYAHYVYAGEVAAGFLGQGNFPAMPVTDAAGNVYVSGFEADYIDEYAPETPAAYPAPASKPICTFSFTKGGIVGLTVDPSTGEPYFYGNKRESKLKWLRSLSPCEGGTFKETSKITPVPERAELFALAFDPVRKAEPSRPPGILYGGVPGPIPDTGPGEPGQSSLGYIFAPLIPSIKSPPVVEAESVSHVTSTTAQLHATINPKGFSTRYVFQYLSEAEYEEGGESFAGASEAPLGGAVLGDGTKAVAAAANLSGLEPATEYRYRAVATSHCSQEKEEEVCEAPGATQDFRTFPVEAAGLPDHRAYELVSPVKKHGGEVFPANPSVASCGGECKPGAFLAHFTMRSSPDGEAVAYEGAPFSSSEGAVLENEYLSKRTGAGWQTAALSPSLQSSGEGSGYKAFNADLTRGLIKQLRVSLNPEAPGEYTNLYSQPTAAPSTLEPLLHMEPLGSPSVQSFNLRYAGASADFSRLFFEANYALETSSGTPALDEGESKYNLYEWAGGQLRLVNVNPNLTTAPGAAFGAPEIPPYELAALSHAISDDGSRVFWTSEGGEVFVRVDGTETERIEAPGKFLAAAADGSKVLLDDGCLYDLQTKTCDELTKDKEGIPRGGFEGILGAGEDLSWVYFVDTEALTEPSEANANPKGPEHAEAGKFNLYAWHAGTTRFVASLLSEDGRPGFGGRGDWAPSPTQRTAEASPNGEWLAFLSWAPLSGDDNTGPCETDHAGGFVSSPCSEAFLYDATADELICASCNPSGARPLGPTHLPLIVEGVDAAVPQPRYLTNSGRLYFDTQDSLTPSDTNAGNVSGRAVEDVYQYEPQGAGTCEREGGCVALISAGREAVDSNFLATDETGKNVFFTSRDQLVLKDKDDLVDLYDAREEGGIPAETEVGESECQGEACQPPVSAPNDPTPGSSSFEGPGNVVGKEPRKPARCVKGKIRRHGRCVAKKHHKRAKRHPRRAANYNRGGAK